MPPSVNMVIDSLHAKGFEAYAVGGCVRDTILAREPDDWDITTSASPQQVKEIFDRTVDTVRRKNGAGSSENPELSIRGSRTHSTPIQNPAYTRFC